MIDEIRSPSQALDSELLAGPVDGIVDPRAVFDRSVQLVGEVAGHADAPDLDLGPVDLAVPEAQKADVSQALAGHLLERLQ